MTKDKCECPSNAILMEGWEDTYDKEKELPFVTHKPNECKCTNELRLYKRKGKKLRLCSNCVYPGEDIEIKEEADDEE